MCGRYYVDDDMFHEIGRIVSSAEDSLRNAGISHYAPRDIHPSDKALILTAAGNGSLQIREMRWGFARQGGRGLLINARAETAQERPTFRDSVLHRRCVIPAKHFYEWDSAKNKVSFSVPGKPVLYMAGFYNLSEGQERFIILTTAANPSVRSVHDRMPLLLEEDQLTAWIWDNRLTASFLKRVMPALKADREYEQQKLLF